MKAKLFPEERQLKILDELTVKPKILVADLAKELGVSQFTVRADLDLLEREGKLRRCHGGALPLASKTGVVLNYNKRLARRPEEKQRIGAAAAEFVEEGDCIAVDTGTTTIELVKNINPKIEVTIMTNDFCIAELAEETLPNARILFLGGIIRRGYRYTNGPEVLWGMERFRTDKAFLSTNGYTALEGFTSEDPDQAQVKRAYVKQARQSYVLVDESKLGMVSFVKFADVSEIDAIITSAQPSPEDIASLRAKNENIQIIVR